MAVLNGEGPNKGKIAAIVNVIDQNRVLVDGPTSGVLRQVLLYAIFFSLGSVASVNEANC